MISKSVSDADDIHKTIALIKKKVLSVVQDHHKGIKK